MMELDLGEPKHGTCSCTIRWTGNMLGDSFLEPVRACDKGIIGVSWPFCDPFVANCSTEFALVSGYSLQASFAEDTRTAHAVLLPWVQCCRAAHGVQSVNGHHINFVMEIASSRRFVFSITVTWEMLRYISVESKLWRFSKVRSKGSIKMMLACRKSELYLIAHPRLHSFNKHQ